MMRGACSKICALVLVLAMMPGAFEVLENATHLVTVGHLAHAAADGDQHAPSDVEHGCTPIFHSCACHSGLVFLAVAMAPTAGLRVAGFSRQQTQDAQLTSFSSPLERPPQI